MMTTLGQTVRKAARSIRFLVYVTTYAPAMPRGGGVEGRPPEAFMGGDYAP